MLADLTDKNADINGIALRATEDHSLLSELIDGLKLKVDTKSAEETVRYNCYKVLLLLAETRGELLYPAWERVVVPLKSDNSYHKMAAVQLVARLASADVGEKFENVFETYFGLLDDKSVIVAIYVAQNAGRIVKAKPGLEPRITGKLLALEKTHHPSSRKGLVIAGAIESFGQYLDMASDRGRIVDFVKRQQQSESPKTKKLAKDFLKKWASLAA